MPIVERTPQECFDVFVEHVRGLMSATVTTRHVIIPVRGEERVTIAFRAGGPPIAVPLETRYGDLHFYFGHAAEAVKRDDGKYQLKTRQYWYRLQHASEFNAPAAIRWEYDRLRQACATSRADGSGDRPARRWAPGP